MLRLGSLKNTVYSWVQPYLDRVLVYWEPYDKNDTKAGSPQLKKLYAYPKNTIQYMQHLQRIFNIIQMIVIGFLALAYAGSILGWPLGIVMALMAVANEFVDNENITAAEVDEDLPNEETDEDKLKLQQTDLLNNSGKTYFLGSIGILLMVVVQTSIRMATMVINALINFGCYRGNINSDNFKWFMFAIVVGLCSGVSDFFIAIISHLKYWHKALFSTLEPNSQYTEDKKDSSDNSLDSKSVIDTLSPFLKDIKTSLFKDNSLNVATVLKPYFSFLANIPIPGLKNSEPTDFYLFMTMITSASLYFFAEFFNMKTILERTVLLGVYNLSPSFILLSAFVYGSIAYINQLTLWGYNNIKFIKGNDALKDEFKDNFSWLETLKLGPYTRRFIFYLRVYALCAGDLFSLLVLSPRKSFFSTLFFVILLISSTINKQIILHFQSRPEKDNMDNDWFNNYAKSFFTASNNISFDTINHHYSSLQSWALNVVKTQAKKLPDNVKEHLSPVKSHTNREANRNYDLIALVQ